jgi:drug/metabolite transporter (DMT)-like permease
MQNREQWIKWALLVVLSLIWGSSFILIKRGLMGYGYIEAASIRMMAAGAVMLPLGIGNFKRIPEGKMKYILISGAIGMFIPAFLFCMAQQHITSATAGILNALTPVFTFVFSIFLFKSPFRSLQATGVLVGLASSIFLVVVRTEAALTLNAFAMLIIVATVCYGMNVNISKEKLGGIPPIVVATTTVSVAGLLAFCLVFLPRYSHYSLESSQIMPFLSLVALGTVGTGLAQILFLRLLSTTSALFASAVTYTMPIVAIGWGVYDGEAFGWAHVLGIGGILAGVLLIRKG